MEAYIIDGIRTPIGRHGGSLASVRPDDMAALVFKSLLERNKLGSGEMIEDVILGCANQAGEDNRNVARMALLLAGMPETVPGVTVNRLCASGLEAVAQAARAIKAGEGDIYIAGGVESMTRAPFVMAKSESAFSRDIKVYDTAIGWRFVNPKMQKLHGTDSMGETAENLAEMYKIPRESQDEFAYNSQRKAAAARESGRFKSEIVPVELPQKKGETVLFEADEFLRPETTQESLAKLKPAFREGGTVTAGNSSGINDGAAALLIAGESSIKSYGLNPKARIISSAASGVAPRIMGIGPVTAVRKALERAKLTIEEMDVIEINEAFAAQVLSVAKELNIDPKDGRLNPNGGAIALGHPLGMSGARLALTAAAELEKIGGRYALVSLCIGVGQGMAMVIERV